MATIKFDKYGQAIINEVIYGTHNVLVDACAGAGKTTLIVESVKRLPKNFAILIVTFNKSIRDELKQRISKEEFPNVRILTFHGLGYAIVKENHPKRVAPKECAGKYMTELNEYLLETQDQRKRMTTNQYVFFRNNIIKLIEYARVNTCETVEDIASVAYKYNVSITCDECEVVYHMLEWGKTHIEDIDFGDMIWLPHVLNYQTDVKYDFLFIDEAQDTSPVEQSLVFKTMKPGARFFAFGDPNQCINAWAGADVEAFRTFLTKPNTEQFTLPVTRRCSQMVTQYAQLVVPSIIAVENAPEGSVSSNIKPEEPISGDMVLCRNLDPLLKLYNHYLEINKKAYIKGDDIDKSLIDLLNMTKEEDLNKSLRNWGVFAELYKILFDRIDDVAKSTGLLPEEVATTEEIANLYCMIQSLEILSNGIKTKSELTEKITMIFSNTNGEGVCLSTIHKAKGLESENVYILGDSLMPSRLAKQEWEKVAEQNLRYVAYTRAKKNLYFISEEAFPVNNAFRHPDHYLRELGELKEIVTTLDKIPREKKKKIVTVEETKIPPKKIGGMKYKMFMS